MKLTYKQRILLFIFVVFALFLTCVIISEQQEQKKYRTEVFEARLDAYVNTVHQYLEMKHLSSLEDVSSLNSLKKLLPEGLRLTLITTNGRVVYDDVTDVDSLQNHMDRPEILKAQYQDYGTHIRTSSSTHQAYMYYAKLYKQYFVRVALPYNLDVQTLLRTDNYFIYLVLILFVLVLVLINYVAGRFGKSLNRLKMLATSIKEDKPLPHNLKFPNDELGEIGDELLDIFQQKGDVKETLISEREKFIQHFQYAEIGLCMFDANRKSQFVNTHFLQYFNFIAEQPGFDVNSIFGMEAFRPITAFIDAPHGEKYFVTQLTKNGRIFSIQIILFDDSFFEITIKDITAVEKTRLLKQEMTNNIAHELRTPVTSLRGYLETLNNLSLPEEKRKQFEERAYLQSIRLSVLLEDISMITNIEGNPSRFSKERINVKQLIDDVRIDLINELEKHNIKLEVEIASDLTINGNYTLLYSVFRNMIDNSIKYAGDEITIHISSYMEDNGVIYFSYYDTGGGVPEESLNRLFERFYRIDQGRTRNYGGSGLGLSIVKNAILLHQGDIQARNRDGGGLEFLFTLRE